MDLAHKITVITLQLAAIGCAALLSAALLNAILRLVPTL